MLSYMRNRVATLSGEMPGLVEIVGYMDLIFTEIKKLPASLKPKYVAASVEKIFNASVCALKRLISSACF